MRDLGEFVRYTTRSTLAGGVRLDVVSRQLGHASVAITADTYGHPDDKALQGAAELVAQTFEGRRAK